MSEEKRFEPDQALMEVYMQKPALDDQPDKDHKVAYIKMRYNDVMATYLTLQLQHAEATESNDQEMLNKLSPLFRNNFKKRYWAVKELLAAGEKVEDKMILRVLEDEKEAARIKAEEDAEKARLEQAKKKREDAGNPEEEVATEEVPAAG